jgi:hypothetical protein
MMRMIKSYRYSYWAAAIGGTALVIACSFSFPWLMSGKVSISSLEGLLLSSAAYLFYLSILATFVGLSISIGLVIKGHGRQAIISLLSNFFVLIFQFLIIAAIL